jgi:hypothetical protein
MGVERTAGGRIADPHKLTHINAPEKWSPRTDLAPGAGTGGPTLPDYSPHSGPRSGRLAEYRAEALMLALQSRPCAS